MSGISSTTYPGGGVKRFAQLMARSMSSRHTNLPIGRPSVLIGEFGFDNFNGKVAFPGPDWVGDCGHYYVSANAVITLPWKPIPDVTISINPRSATNITARCRPSISASSRIHTGIVGLDFNYKAITLDLRYWGTNIDPGNTTAVNFTAETIRWLRCYQLLR